MKMASSSDVKRVLEKALKPKPAKERNDG